jgi:hypothetical protein
MKIKKIRYNIKKSNSIKDSALTCPDCGEQLCQADIEHFPSCPYCNCQIPRNSQLEDFILQPIIEHWASQYYYPIEAKESYLKSTGII